MPTNLTKFNNAMTEYLQYNKRELPVILKKVNADIQFFAAEHLTEADKPDIKDLENKPWWWKFIAKLTSKGVKVTRTRKDKTTGQRVKVKSEEVGRGKKKKSYVRFLKKVSKSVINARIRGIGLLKSAFYKAAAALKGGTARFGKGLRQSKGYQKIENGETFKSIAGAIVYSPDNDSENSSANRMNAALEYALGAKADDMYTYIHDKQKKKAAQLSN